MYLTPCRLRLLATRVAPSTSPMRSSCQSRAPAKIALPRARVKVLRWPSGSRGGRPAILVVVARGLHERAEILADLLEGRPADVPPAVVNPMDLEIRRQRERVGNGDEPVLEAGRRHLDDVELPDRASLVVTQERDDRGAQASAKRGGDLGRVGADDGQMAIVDLELGLEGGEVPDLARALRSPVPPIKAHDQRKPLSKLRELDESTSVIRQFEIGELLAGDEIGAHGFLLGANSTLTLPHDSSGRRPAHGRSASNVAAARSTSASSKRRPTICRPTGSPLAVQPAGMDTAGCPL